MEHLVVSALFWKNVLDQQLMSPSLESQYFISDQRQRKDVVSRRLLSKKRSRDSFHKYFQRKQHERILSFKKKKPVTVIFAPHPDDEVLCCSLRIEEKVKEGKSVKIIFVTDGDAYDSDIASLAQNYGRIRKEESKKAAVFLGLKESDLFFLGFPDGHLAELEEKQVVQSSFTKQRKTSRSSYFPFEKYTKGNLEKNLKDLLSRYEIEEVIVPSSTQDDHSDHRFVGKVVHSVLKQQSIFPKILEYTVHGKVFADIKNIEVNTKKLKIIRIFQSQFHDVFHQKFMEKWAYIPESFDQIREYFVRN
ncbi:PIG-L family deacetylase [Candidatus Gracilibacteria bacterium]|nr:PIG-L family deacetylase [Candidatus Gracilibacteria bacterium]